MYETELVQLYLRSRNCLY